MLTLITGGARSGKSTFAQTLCDRSSRITYIATATAGDDEMRTRIERHKLSRPAHWATVEEPLRLAETLEQCGNSDLVLIDCLTIWLSNLLFELRDLIAEEIEQRVNARVADFLQSADGRDVIAVTNEVGTGIVPNSALARLFRDLQGVVNQQVAARAHSVYLLVCGIPLQIKGAR